MVEEDRGVENVSLHLLEKIVCFARVQGSPVTPSCFRQVQSLHFLLLMIYRIFSSQHVGVPHTIVPKTVPNHHGGTAEHQHEARPRGTVDHRVPTTSGPPFSRPSDRSRGISQLRDKARGGLLKIWLCPPRCCDGCGPA